MHGEVLCAGRGSGQQQCRTARNRTRTIAAALIAGATASAAPDASAVLALPEWTEGDGAGTYNLTTDLAIDLNGDGYNDLTLSGSDCLGCGWGL